MESMKKYGDSHVKTLITNYSKPKSKLALLPLTKEEEEQLLKRPGPFQPELILNEN